MREAVQAVEAEVGVEGFFDRLLHDDDWSFIVKLHALIEACLTAVVTRSLAKPDLRHVISRLHINDQQRGKLAFVKALHLLPATHVAFVREVAEARNNFVHDIHHMDMTIDRYLGEMKRERQKTFLSSVAALMNDKADLTEHPLKAIEFVRRHPRLGIYIGAVDLLVQVYLRTEGLKRRDVRRAVADHALENITARIRADPANLA